VNERIDEEIGALLDGRVDERRRGELLARLAAADDDYDVFADTAAVLREAEGGASEEVPELDWQPEMPRSTPVIPLRAGERAAEAATAVEREPETLRSTPEIPLSPRRASVWRSPAVRVLAAAAVLAAVALPVLRSRNGGGWQDPARLAVLASPSGDRLPAEWTHAWYTTRGVSDSIPNTDVAAQVGALHLDMEVAARSADPVDSGTVKQLAREAASKLEHAAEYGPSLAATKYDELEQLTDWSRGQVLARLAAARTEVVQDVERDYFAVGAWTEAARLAARRRDAAFFRSAQSRQAVDRAVGLEGLTAEDKQAAERVRAVVKQGKIQGWKSFEGNLDELQRRISHSIR